jgi:hypothetical protein
MFAILAGNMWSGNRKSIFSVAAFAVILIFFCYTYYADMLHMKPRGLHDWAQADRLSLAMCFYDNGMNFFKPATHNVYSANGITGVEFPIQAYMAAIAGNFFGRHHISTCFRLLDTIIACVGLSFLFMAAYKRTKDFVFSIATPLFVFCSPMFIYYACNYVPDAAAVAILFIAFYFVLDYFDERRTGDMVAAVALMTLATLIKTSEGLYLLGFIALIAIQRFSHPIAYKRRSHIFFVVAAAMAITLPIVYYFYNQYLNRTYHSTVFLSRANPFKSWDHFLEYINVHFKLVWMREYLELAQYLVAGVVFVVGLPFLRATRAGRNSLWLLLFFLFGVLCMGYLMGGQLIFHDYYVLSIFLPLIAFAFLVSVIAIRKRVLQEHGLTAWRRGWTAAIFIMFFFADFHHHQRLKPDYYPFGPGIPWAYDGYVLMDELGIPRSERIAVLNDDSPNISLVHLDRRGYHFPLSLSKHTPRVVQLMKQLKVHILVCETHAGNHIMHGDDNTRGRFKTLATRDRIMVLSLLP